MMANHMVDPITAMNAAVISVGNGEAGEIELEWWTENEDQTTTHLIITIRREVRHIKLGGDSNED